MVPGEGLWTGSSTLPHLHHNLVVAGLPRLDRKARDRVDRESEERLSARGVSIPATVVPDLTGEIVARVEQLSERDIAELGDREERRGLHLDADAAFGDAPGGLRASLPEDGIGGPCLPVTNGTSRSVSVARIASRTLGVGVTSRDAGR